MRSAAKCRGRATAAGITTARNQTKREEYVCPRWPGIASSFCVELQKSYAARLKAGSESLIDLPKGLAAVNVQTQSAAKLDVAQGARVPGRRPARAMASAARREP